MEKLQMAANAIGDIDSLLQAPTLPTVRRTAVMNLSGAFCSLSWMRWPGKTWRKRYVSMREASDDATMTLERANIEELLGAGDGAEYVGPRAPKLLRSPARWRFRNSRSLLSMAEVRARKSRHLSGPGQDLRERICFDPVHDQRQLVLTQPHTPSFKDW